MVNKSEPIAPPQKCRYRQAVTTNSMAARAVLRLAAISLPANARLLGSLLLLTTLAILDLPLFLPEALSSPSASEPAKDGAKPTDDAAPGLRQSEESAPDERQLTPTILKGGIKGAALRTEDGLSKIGEATTAVQSSCMQIMKEATRKDTIVVRGPNVLPGGVVIPPLGGVGGVMQFGEMPMRRERLARFVCESEQSIKALKNYVDALIIPEDKMDQFASIWNNVLSTVADAQEHLAKLKELSSEKKLRNTKIGREALAIHDDMTGLEKSRALMLELITGKQLPDEHADEGTKTR